MIFRKCIEIFIEYCYYLSLWNNPRVLEVSAMSGQIFETYAKGDKEYERKV